MISDKVLKFQILIDEQKLGNECPGLDAKEISLTPAYRWILSPIDNNLNFLPNIKYDLERGRAPRRKWNGDICKYCGISIFSDKALAIRVYRSVDGRRMGYTHLAQGQIALTDGKALDSTEPHFSFFEYCTANLKTKFQQIMQL